MGKMRIVVVVNGGVVTAVYCNWDAELIVLDRDIDGADEADLIPCPIDGPEGGEVYVYEGDTLIYDEKLVAKIFGSVHDQKKQLDRSNN